MHKYNKYHESLTICCCDGDDNSSSQHKEIINVIEKESKILKEEINNKYDILNDNDNNIINLINNVNNIIDDINGDNNE